MTMLEQVRNTTSMGNSRPDDIAEPGPGGLQALVAAAARNRDAARSAMQDALSGDSETFLKANRQASGQ